MHLNCGIQIIEAVLQVLDLWCIGLLSAVDLVDIVDSLVRILLQFLLDSNKSLVGCVNLLH